MTLSEAKELFEYNAWANQRVADSLVSINEEQFSRSIGGSHGSIRGTLTHLGAAEKIWLERWQGKAANKMLQEKEFETIDKAVRRLKEIDTEMLEFIKQFPESDLEMTKDYTTTDGRNYSNKFQHMFTHLINHSTYHRGQLATLLRQIGAIPKSTDIMIYYRILASPTA